MRQRILMIVLAFILASACAARAGNWNVELVGKTPGAVLDVYILDNYAYLCAGSVLVILDISDPSNPAEVGQVYVPDIAWGVHVSGSYAYVADGGAGLRVIDISSPSDPQEVGFCDTPGSAYGAHVYDGYAYVADGGGLRVIDISTPSNPHEVGFYDTPGSALGAHVYDGYAYVADDDYGLRVIDVSAPSNPQEVGFYDTPGYAREVYVSGGYAYVADMWVGLLILRYTSAPQYELELAPDWNLISIPIELVYSTLDELLQPIADRCKAVWAYDAGNGEWLCCLPDGSSFPNTLVTIEVGKGYLVDMDDYGSLTFDEGTICDDPIPLEQGWNLAGYNCGEERSVESALSHIIGNVLSVWTYDSSDREWKCYGTDAPEVFNSLKNMDPWVGYWIEVKDGCTWSVP